MVIDPKYGALRRHQLRAAEIAHAITDGTWGSKLITANVTPGGGKTLMASVFAHLLLSEGMIDHVLIVVPRDSLRSQVRDGFTDPMRGLRRQLLTDGKKGLDQRNAFGQVCGYVTTYQAIAANGAKWARKLGRGRWLVVFDEPHHLANVADIGVGDDPSWAAAVRPLFDAATYVLLMSGTMRRHDRQQIPFVEYDEEGKPKADIVYRRQDALEEKAILPTSFTFMDGNVSWSRRGTTHALNISEAKLKELGDAVRTALGEDGYRDGWLLQSLGEWMAYRETHYKSRAIVICHTQAVARMVAAVIREALKVDVSLAISDEPRAQKVLRDFRDSNGGHVLVTVGMAYEGLDVPDCTHLVCLSNVMSEPWLEQAFARVTRVNSKILDRLPWERQHAYVYALDHQKMREFVRELNAQQDEAIRVHTPGATSHPRGRSSYHSIDGEVGSATYAVAGEVFSSEQSAGIERVKAELPFLATHSARELLEIALRLGYVATSSGETAAE